MANKQSHPFLDPLWRRILLVAVCAIWTVVEVFYGTPFWIMLVGALTVYAAWTYVYIYEPSEGPPG